VLTLDKLFELIDRQARHVRRLLRASPYRNRGESGMEEENAWRYQPTELSVSRSKRVNDVETLTVDMSCRTSYVGVATGTCRLSVVSGSTPSTSTSRAIRRSSAVEHVASARSCEADYSFCGLIQAA
jgi:hypothetical protein